MEDASDFDHETGELPLSDRAFVAICESVMRRMAHTIKTVIGKDGALSAVDRVKQELTEGDE